MLILVAVVSLPAIAAAQSAGDPNSRDQARVKLSEAATLFEARDYAGALILYKEAHAIFPSPRIQYNIGLTYEKLGRWGSAFMAFERFLRQSTDSPAQYVVHSRKQLERLSSKVAFVTLSCDVSDADVELDGDLVGRTPLPGRLAVDTGPHDIVIRTPVLGSTTRRFTAVAGQPLDLKVEVRRTGPTAVVPRTLPRPVAVGAESAASQAPPVANRKEEAENASLVRQEPETPGHGDGGARRIGGVGLLVGSVAAVVAGVTFLAVNGKPTCDKLAPGAQCDSIRDTKLLGWSFIAGGGAAAIGGAFLLYRSSRTNISLAVTPSALVATGRF